MKYSRALVAGMAACAFLTACDDKDDPTGPGQQASVRFVNATSDVTGLNFSVNGTASTTAQNLAFGGATTCATVNSGATTFGATRTGGTVFGTNLNQSLTANGDYTVVATGTAANPQFLFLNDATQAPTSGNARLRIINALPGATASDVFVTAPNATLGTASATNIGFNAGTTFLNVPAGQTQIRFRTAGTQTVTYTGTAFNLTAGQTQTVIIAPGTTPGTFRTITVTPCP